MNRAEWMARAESLLNRMENAEYKSAAYFEYQRLLKAHLASKSSISDTDFADSGLEAEAWQMTGPVSLY